MNPYANRICSLRKCIESPENQPKRRVRIVIGDNSIQLLRYQQSVQNRMPTKRCGGGGGDGRPKRDNRLEIFIFSTLSFRQENNSIFIEFRSFFRKIFELIDQMLLAFSEQIRNKFSIFFMRM